MAKTDEARPLAIARLAESGLTPEDARQLNLELLEAHEVPLLCPKFKPLPAVRFNYMDPFRPDQLLSSLPKGPPFYRLRYLKEPNDFTKVTEKKPPRYVQEPDSGLCAYFPTINTDWPSVLSDPNKPLIITEGEFKAAAACKVGYPTIGLGGVYSFRSAEHGITFLDELTKIKWVGRHVYLIFDSDYRTNGQVCAALQLLAEELCSRGARPYVVPLPDLSPEKKTGLDDFIVGSNTELGDLIHDTAQPLTLARTLFDINSEVVYVRDPGFIVRRDTNRRISCSSFIEHAYAAKSYSEQSLASDGRVVMKPASAAAAWIKWPLRAEVERLTYAPGKPKEHEGCWNVWPGWGVEPKRGSVEPFHELLDNLFLKADPQAKRWFIQWLSYPLKFPGTKLFTSACVFGITQGTGKSLVGFTMAEIYGKNFTEIKQEDLHANHNEWAENKQFILADDVTGVAKRQDADLLKKLITQKEVRLNPKYIPSYTVPDVINYYFTSNQPDAFFLEDDDRRFFIHEVHPDVPPLPPEFYQEYTEWLRGGGASALFYYLLRVDTEDFNPAGHAFKTRAKQAMIEDVRSDLGEWVRALRDSPDTALRVGDMKVPGDLFTSKQLLALYDPLNKTGTTANGLSREMKRAGFRYFNDGAPIHAGGVQGRYYVVRNKKLWDSAKLAQAAQHLEALLRPVTPPPTKKKF